MGVRRTLSDLLLGPRDQSRVKSAVEEALAARSFATKADLQAAVSTDAPELEARVAKLEKKLDMAMGAVQAATAQLMVVKTELADAISQAKAARQEATTARNTAESLAEGLEALEAQLHATPAPAAATAAPAQPRAEGCAVGDCDGKLRAKGFCGRHYNAWRRGALPWFVGPSGELHDDEAAFGKVDARFAARAFSRDGAAVVLGDERVKFSV